MRLTLRPVTGTEYEAWAARAVAGYAAEIAASGELSPEAALAKARGITTGRCPTGWTPPGSCSGGWSPTASQWAGCGWPSPAGPAPGRSTRGLG